MSLFELTLPTAESSRRFVVTIVGICFALGFLSASLRWGSALADQLNRIVFNATDTYTALYEATRTTPTETFAYLVYLDPHVDTEVYMAFFRNHPDIEYLGESALPNAVRVALSIPVNTAVADLDSQPFARLVVPDYPLLLCH